MIRYEGDGARILDFDCESRPLSFLGSDFTTDEITAIAAGWVGEPRRNIRCWTVGVRCQHGSCAAYHHGTSTEDMLASFLELYEQADIVTGHYILGFDLPIVSGMMLEAGFGPLPNKLVSDTKVHLKKRKSISVSQENLGAMLGLSAPKVSMNTPKWRQANRLTPEGIALTRKRVVGDVVQHMELRRELLRRDWLNPPSNWSSNHHAPEYVP